MMTKRILPVLRLLVLLACWPVSGLLASSESYVQSITGHLKKGDSLMVIDDKFLNLPLAEWNQLKHLSVEDIISFELRQDTALNFYTKSFSCKLNVTIKYFTSRDQTSPKQIENIDLVVRYDTARGKSYPIVARYRFKDAFKIIVVINSISSPEWKDKLPDVFRLKGQIAVERKYPFERGKNGTLHLGAYDPLPATDGSMAGDPAMMGDPAMGGVPVVGGPANLPHFAGIGLQKVNGALQVSWSTGDFGGAEEYDLEWTYIDGQSSRGLYIASLAASGPVIIPPLAEEGWMDKDATRVTVTSSPYRINLPYQDGYVLVRIRKITYPSPDLRLPDVWVNSDDQGNTALVSVSSFNDALSWQYTGTFAEEGKKREVLTFFDGAGKSRQTVTLSNGDQWKNSGDVLPNPTAIVQETIYDVMGRPSVTMLPAPVRNSSLNYYPNFNLNSSSQPYSYTDITNNGGSCAIVAGPAATTSGASQYFSPNNAYLSLPQDAANPDYYTQYVADAKSYPFATTEYTADNTKRIRRQGGVGPDLKIESAHNTQYFYGKPTSTELERLFGMEVGNSSHYGKNMIVDANGQASVNYVDVNSKTIATAMAGSVGPTIDPLSTTAAAKTYFRETLIKPDDFSANTAGLNMTASSTFLQEVPGPLTVVYSVNPLALVTNTSAGQLCNDCYYSIVVKVTDGCGSVVPGGTANTHPFTLNDFTCYVNPTPITDSLTTGALAIGEYNVTYTLQLSQDAINAQTDYYIAHNPDLRTLDNFYQDELKKLDLSTCYNTCDACKSLTSVGDFSNKVMTLLSSEDFSALNLSDPTFSGFLSNWIDTTFTSLQSHCSSITSTCVTSPCEEKLAQLKADVMPGGQYALYDVNALASGATTGLFLDLATNVLPNYTNSTIGPTTFIADDGTTQTIGSLNQADFIRAYINHPEWADLFVTYHVEYCSYLWCKDASNTTTQVKNEASYIFDANLQQNYQSGTDAANAGYYNHGDVLALLKQDPWFNSGRGIPYYSQMQSDLQTASDVLSMTPTDNGTRLSTKNLIQLVDWLLYCKPTDANISAAQADASWNSCTPNDNCRSVTMEWTLYLNYYLQLKSKYYRIAKLATSPYQNCLDCFIGTDPLATAGCVVSGQLSDYTVTLEHTNSTTYTAWIVYQNGAAPFASNYTISYDFLPSELDATPTGQGTVYAPAGSTRVVLTTYTVPQGSSLGLLGHWEVNNVTCAPSPLATCAMQNPGSVPGSGSGGGTGGGTAPACPAVSEFSAGNENPDEFYNSAGDQIVTSDFVLAHPGGAIQQNVIVHYSESSQFAFNGPITTTAMTRTFPAGTSQITLGKNQTTYGADGSYSNFTFSIDLNNPNTIECTAPACPTVGEFHLEQRNQSPYTLSPDLECRFYSWDVYLVHNNNVTVSVPVTMTVDAVNNINKPNGGGFVSSTDYPKTVTIPAGQSEVKVDTYPFAQEAPGADDSKACNTSDWVWTINQTAGTTCGSTTTPPTPLPSSTCTSNPLAAAYQNKIRVFNDYTNVQAYNSCNATSMAGSSLQQQQTQNATQVYQALTYNLQTLQTSWLSLLQSVRDEEFANDPTALAALNNTVLTDITTKMQQLSMAYLNYALANGLPLVVSSTMPPGQTDPNGYSNYAQIFAADLTPNLIQRGFSADLIDNAYPYDKEPVAADLNAVQLSSDVYSNVVTNLAAFQTRYQQAGSPGTFSDYLKSQLGDDYILTAAELADIQARIAGGCTYPYLANPTILPVALTISPSLSSTNCNTIVSLKSSFLSTYSQVPVDSKLYQILLTNYLNHSLGYPLSYSDYASVLSDGGCTGQLVYDKPQTPTVYNDYFACSASLFGQAYTLAGQEYDIYITAIRIAFRNAYVAKCLSNQPSAIVAGQRQEYEYTLYYYDQAGNLIKTIPPEGVRLLTDQQIAEVEELPGQDPAACSLFPPNIVYDAPTILNDLASGLQNNTAKSMEMWLYSADGTSTRQMRLIDQNDKYMYQVAISGGKIWAELYSMATDGNGGISITQTNEVEALLPANLPLLSWTHVVIESDGGLVGGAVQIYVDGNKLTMLSAAATDPYPFSWEINAGPTLPAVDYSQIKHIRVYNQPLSDQQVLADFKNSCLMIDQSIPGADLNFWGRFDAPSFCNNSTGRTTSLPVADKGSLSVTALANPNGSLNNNAFPAVTSNFTMEFWVKPGSGMTDHVTPGYVYSGVDDHPPYAIFPMFGSLDGTVAGAGVSVGLDGITLFEHTMNYLPVRLDLRWQVTTWTHVAVVYQNNIPNIFVNGVQQTFNTTPSTKTIFPSFNFGGSSYGVMLGNLDEVRIWNYARSADQISKAYNRTLSPSEQDGLIGYWPMDNTWGNTFHDISCGNNNNEPFTSPAEGWVGNGAPLTDTNYVEFANRLVVPNHGIPTSYAYNSLNKVISQSTPDGGSGTYVYDRMGRMVVSQSSEQLHPKIVDAQNPAGRYTYIHYDPIGRVDETGEKIGGDLITEATAQDIELMKKWYTKGTNRKVTVTAYDAVPSWAPTSVSNLQTNLRKRVAATALLSSGSDPTQNRVSATYYNYDITGFVADQFQENAALAADEAQLISGVNGLKHIHYDYDLMSGKVNKLSYQSGKWDQFFYLYKYDDDNRMIGAYSSRIDESLLSNWTRDAGYIYYHHGPVARMELGSSRVQGLDYAYTIEGWMKGVNGQQLSTSAATSTDIGGDGSTNSAYSSFSRDVFGYSLGYFNGDYKPIGASANAFSKRYTATGASTTSGQDLFNGNITSATYAIAPFEYSGASGNVSGFVGYTYRYDQLNRLTGMDRHAIAPTASGWDNSTIVNNGDYQERVSYDGNGNILSYNRNGRNVAGRGNTMDQLTYNYNRDINGNLVNNKLRHIHDGITQAAPAGDPQDLLTQGTDNYNYDETGDLISDTAQQISRINWNVHGKIETITKFDGSSIAYGYDPANNRITKSSKTAGGITNTHYVRDAQGSVLAVYQYKENTSGVASEGDWLEQHLYGNGRVGLVQPHKVITPSTRRSDAYTPGDDTADQAGNRIYEMTNHLGNVLVTINDALNPANATPNPNLISAQDYYPFGMLMPGRTYIAGGSSNYRYGFNGKENDNEVEGVGNQIDYGLRVYDPRAGRFLSMDPLAGQYPWYTPYQYAGDKPVWMTDLDGAEEKNPTKYLDIRLRVDLRNMPATHTTKSGVTTTTKTREDGIIKDNPDWYWDEVRVNNPDIIWSKSNTYAIDHGLSPVADNVFIKQFPQFKDFKGQILEMHHLDQSMEWGFALPWELHRGAGFYKLWHAGADALTFFGAVMGLYQQTIGKDPLMVDFMTHSMVEESEDMMAQYGVSQKDWSAVRQFAIANNGRGSIRAGTVGIYYASQDEMANFKWMELSKASQNTFITSPNAFYPDAAVASDATKKTVTYAVVFWMASGSKEFHPVNFFELAKPAATPPPSQSQQQQQRARRPPASTFQNKLD